MARTRSDSGLSSARLGMTSSNYLSSYGGQLATSTPLTATPAAGLKAVSTSSAAGLTPGLRVALQESARVRRRLADELTKEAIASTERGSGDFAGRWPSRRPAAADLTTSMVSALGSPALRRRSPALRHRSPSPRRRTSASPPAASSSDLMQSCGDGTDSGESGAARLTARRRHSSEGGISGVSTISSRSMPEWGPVDAAQEVDVVGMTDSRKERVGKDRAKAQREARGPPNRTERGQEEERGSEERPDAAGDTRRRRAAVVRGTRQRPDAALRRRDSGDRRLDGRGDGGDSRQYKEGRGSRRTRQEKRAGRAAAEIKHQETPHQGVGYQDQETPQQGVIYQDQGSSEQAVRYQETPQQEAHYPEASQRPHRDQETRPARGSRHQETLPPASRGWETHTTHTGPTPDPSLPFWEPPRDREFRETPGPGSQRTDGGGRSVGPSVWETPAWSAVSRPSPVAGSVRYLLEHTVAGRSATAATPAAHDGATEAGEEGEAAAGPSAERRQLLDAVSGALSCQLEDEADRLRRLHRQQLQQLRAELEQLQCERQLETDQLREQVAVAERTLQQASREHSRQLAVRDSQLTALREELTHTRQQHQLDRQRLVSELSRSLEQERSALRRRHGRQLLTLSQSAAARLADSAQQQQLATQQLLVTVKSLELELDRRQEQLEAERSRSAELEKLLLKKRTAPRSVGTQMRSDSAPPDSSTAASTSSRTGRLAASPATAAPEVSPAAAPGAAAVSGSTPTSGPGTAAVSGTSPTAAPAAASATAAPGAPGAASATAPPAPADLSGLQLQLAAAHQLAAQLREQLQSRDEAETAALAEQRRQWEGRLEQQLNEHAAHAQSEETAHREQMALQSRSAEEKMALLQSQVALLSLEIAGKTDLVAQISSGLNDQSATSKMDSPGGGEGLKSAVKTEPS
ncbi:uncharacterized protein LOC122375614 [Amphibalanus amphitrite]|uniref:uncharacterized protein LOC122375614 n=1 Tax=Amphibalanus amphitrite TaxID=1232801 RepID=UPI001C91D303|nr:uncharacterized protein LOC122375614 [Amphibalanus amphitrite]